MEKETILQLLDAFDTKSQQRIVNSPLSAEKKQVFLHELLREILGERKVILSKDLLEELKLEYGIDYSADTHKFLEHCTRGGLEYNKATGELIVSRIP